MIRPGASLRRRRGWRLPVLLAWLAGSLAASAGAAPDYRQLYLDARHAERTGRLEAAADGYRAAIAQRPQEAARARLVGAIPEPYLPYHRLGVVEYERRRCAESLAAFAESERQGAVAAVREARAEAIPRRRHCETLDEAERLLATARRRRAELSTGSGTAAAAEAAIADAAFELERARDRWDPGEAERALDRAKAILDEMAVPDGARPEGPAPVEPVSEPPAAESGSPTLPPSPASPQGVPAPVSPELPPNLRAAVDAYFAGSYATAVELVDRELSVIEPGGAREFVARLVRGAARHALFLLDGERDDALREQAADDLRRARRLRPRYRPDGRRFSPRFTAFYEAVGS